MTRTERNLRRRLAAATDRARRAAVGRPFVWGKDDCVLFHANVERAVTGRDPAKKWRGRYRTPRGAHRILGKGGLPAALRRLSRSYGSRKIDPAKARVGDIGLIRVAWAYAVVRLVRRNEWIGRTPSGYSVVPTSMVKFAWSAL